MSWLPRHQRRLRQLQAVLRQAPVLADMAAAAARGRFAEALGMARTASRSPGEAEKIVSVRHRFLWFCIPKVGSRSIMAALRDAAPDALVLREKTVRQIYAERPQAASYTRFAFLRHPFDRALSLYAEMRFFNERFNGRHRCLKTTRQRYFKRSFHGLADVDSFDDYCQWLNTRYGSDAFADGHFRSQHLQMRAPDGRLPDFIGRLETLDEDFAHIAARIGLPATNLPRLNTMLGWQASSLRALQDARAEMRSLLTARNKTLLRERYAVDLALYESVAGGRAATPPKHGQTAE